MADHARFLINFIRHPGSVGAILPSSRWLAAAMVGDLGLEQARTVVEVGPGTGAFTGAALRKIPDDALFLAVELNAEFAADLVRRFPRARVVQDSAENLEAHLAAHGRAGQVDAVLSSLPWASFPYELQERLLRSITASLRPGGRFSTFAYFHARALPGARRFREMLDGAFRTVVTTRVEWRNVPPALVYRCER